MPVDLVKGQRISLDKEVGGALSRVVMGLGWDVAKRGGFLGGHAARSTTADPDLRVRPPTPAEPPTVMG